jgi:tetratricopeptide (TPR) repeat protein
MAGQLEPAASYLQKAVREDYMNMRCWTKLANVYCLLGGPYLELALEQIEMGLGIDANYADLLYLKGNVLAQLGDYNQAAECLQKAVDLQPGHPYADRDLVAVNKLMG